jgi:2-polyprenyl-3-methyl-5-hydroxy-6-metoxy-1,4-benzoquinol methylase
MNTSLSAWPPEDLESVQACPVCGESARELLHAGLKDRVFKIAPGSWDLHRCPGCKSAYLDPRPTASSLGRAYDSYYTHEVGSHAVVRRQGAVGRTLHDWINGYQNARYGLQKAPASKMGSWVLSLLPSLKAAADAECRHMPPASGESPRLLDVGCGNGDFLEIARQAGWQAQGVDLDPAAAATARARGFDVRVGGIDALQDKSGTFDMVTLCHVIEHVPDPPAVLASARSLLKPGGRLWIETPNVDSFGAAAYGACWRDLDPPRHLVIFSRGALEERLRAAGFKGIRQYWRGMAVFDVFAASEAVMRGERGIEGSYGGRPPVHAMVAELREWLQPARREFLTYVAHA